jgi:hypothetical protein
MSSEIEAEAAAIMATYKLERAKLKAGLMATLVASGTLAIGNGYTTADIIDASDNIAELILKKVML